MYQIEVYAPASATILGDHEDYNDGYVLSFALPLKLFIVGSKCNNSTVTTIHAPFYENHTSTFEITPDGLKKGNTKWCNYLKVVYCIRLRCVLS